MGYWGHFHFYTTKWSFRSYWDFCQYNTSFFLIKTLVVLKSTETHQKTLKNLVLVKVKCYYNCSRDMILSVISSPQDNKFHKTLLYACVL